MLHKAFNSQDSNTLPARCQHRTATGRQCRTPLSSTHSTLCTRHAAAQRDDSADLSALLSQNLDQPKSASDLHAQLWNLSLALQQGRISPRRAAVLAYIHSLLLRTLPAIEKQQSSDQDGLDITGAPRPHRVIVNMPRPIRNRPSPPDVPPQPQPPSPSSSYPTPNSSSAPAPHSSVNSVVPLASTSVTISPRSQTSATTSAPTPQPAPKQYGFHATQNSPAPPQFIRRTAPSGTGSVCLLDAQPFHFFGKIIAFRLGVCFDCHPEATSTHYPA